MKDPDYDVTVVMPFLTTEKKLFHIDDRIKLKNQKELMENRYHKPIRYVFALNKRLNILNHNIFLNFISENRFSPKERHNYISFFNREKFDIVLGAGVEYSLLLGEISDKINAKTIGWQHSTFDSYFEKRGTNGYGLMKYVQKCYAKLDDVWVLTKSDKVEYDRKLGLNCKVFYNPIPKQRQVYSSYESGYVLFAGRLEIEHKGLDYLIDIMKRINTEIPNSKLIVIGDGPARNWMKQQIEKNGLSNVISLAGTTNNVYQYYEKASVMLQTSRWEGFGMTIIEAMSCGVPVVAFHNYGPDEIIYDSKDGFLIEKFNVEDFSRKAVKILCDPDLRDKLGKNGIEHSKDFSIERLLPVFTEYLQSAIKGKNNEQTIE